MFKDRFPALTNVDPLEQLKLIGEPLFTEEDITATTHDLDHVLRRICVENKITHAYFNERYRMCAIHSWGRSPKDAGNDRSNLLKAIKAGRITARCFYEFVCSVLGWRIDSFAIHIIDEKGNRKEYRSNRTIPRRDGKEDPVIEIPDIAA